MLLATAVVVGLSLRADLRCCREPLSDEQAAMVAEEPMLEGRIHELADLLGGPAVAAAAAGGGVSPPKLLAAAAASAPSEGGSTPRR